jgi:hydrogenase nickel incorporation protein HypA/HybF
MHELSIAYSLVETAEATAREHNISKIDVVYLRLGKLSGVVKDALLFAYDIAIKMTVLAGSRLEIEELPVVVMCPTCQREQTLPNAQYLCCPACQTPTGQIIQGKEIEIVSFGYQDE